MASEWARVRIGDIAERLTSGGTPSTKKDEYYGGDIPWLRTQEINFNRIYDTELKITREGLNNSSAKIIPADSVIIAMYGATAGKSSINKIPLTTNQACCNIIIDKTAANYEFVYYSLFLNYERLASLSNGAAQQNLSVGSIREFEIPLPPLPIQRQIAAILSAFDDKIELNRQMNRTLEQMARALFKSWFVDFDPVRAKMRGEQPEGMDAATAALFPSELVEVDGREVPKGWEWRGLGKIAENFDSKRKPLSKQQRENFKGPYYYYGAAKPIDSVADFIFDGEYLLLAEDGSVETDDGYPVLQLVNEKFWPNNHTHILSGKLPYTNHFLYLGLSNTKIAPYITGAVQKKITQQNMNSIPFLIASVQIHHIFNERIEDIFLKIQRNDQESARLAQLRDALLPRLMSGEVDVSGWAAPQEQGA